MTTEKSPTFSLYSACLQLRIVAFDTGNPDQRVSTDIIIYVKRNEHSPVFGKTMYTRTITAATELGAPLLTINATDEDTVTVCIHVGFI